jgi:hypothetical protein
MYDDVLHPQNIVSFSMSWKFSLHKDERNVFPSESGEQKLM